MVVIMKNNKSEYKTYYGGTLNFNDAVKCSTLSIMTGKDVIGRLVQVRKNCGSFKTDVFFIRLPDETLQTFENEHIVKIEDDIPNGPDSITAEYTIKGKYPKVGFIVDESEWDVKESSFSMMVSDKGIKLVL